MTLFNPSEATLTNQLDLSTGGVPPHLPLGIAWKPDGTKFYSFNLGGVGADQIREWDVTTAWDLNTAVFLQQAFLDVSTLPLTLRWRDDGLRLFILGGWIELVQYDLTIPWDISSITGITGSFWLGNDDQNRDFDFNSDGTEVYVVGSGTSVDGSDDRIYKLTMTTPFDFSTASYVGGPNPSRHITENIATGFSFNNDGTKMFVHGVNTFNSTGIFEYNLSPPYNYKSGPNNLPVLDTSVIENQITLFPESLHTLRFGGNPHGSKLYFTSGWYVFGGSPNQLYEMSMSFTKTTRLKPFGSVGALIKALGSNGNCGGTNPLASQGIVDNFVQIPTGTISGQRLSIDQDPVRVTNLRFVARRGGVGSAGTVKGVIYTSSVPGETITDENIIEESINEIPCADITTDLAGDTISFDFEGDKEVTDSDDVFVGLDFQNCDDIIELGTESTGTAIPGGLYTTEENCEVIRLRSNRNGGNINFLSQGNWEIFPLSSAHSNVLPLGAVITHIRVTRGTTNNGVNSRFRLAIYSGPGNGFSNACTSCATPLNNSLRATTAEVSFSGLGVAIGDSVDIPLQNAYIIDSSDHNDIQVCRGVFNDGMGGDDPPIDFKSNDKNTLRKRIGFAQDPYPNFPSDWLLNQSDLDNEAFHFLLLGPAVNPDIGVKCFVEEDIVDLSFNITIDEEVRQRGCFSMGAILLGNTVTRTTDPDQFKIGAKFKFTTAVSPPACPSVRLKGTSGISGGIPPVEPKISALLQRTVGMGGIGNEPSIGALISDAGIKFTCVNAHRKRLGENGTEGAGLKSSGVNALLAQGTGTKETFIGAKLKFPILEQFFTGARLVGANTKIKTFGIGAIIITDFNTNGGNGITKPFLISTILTPATAKSFFLDSVLSIPVGMSPFTRFDIDAVINGLTIEFDIDVVIEDPFQVLEGESVLGIGGGGS